MMQMLLQAALPAGARPEEYIEGTTITSTVPTYFAKVIGRQEVINHVKAVAHAVPGYRKSAYGGNALVALNKDDCPAFDYGGGQRRPSPAVEFCQFTV